MGSRYQNKLSLLRKQFDESRLGSIGLFWAAATSFMLLFIVALFLPHSEPASVSPGVSSTIGGSPVGRPLNWIQDTERRVNERTNWLENSPFGKSTADRYWSFSKNVSELFIDPQYYQTTRTNSVIDFSGWVQNFKEAVVSSLLRLGFVFIPFWFLWVIAGLAGFYGGRTLLKPRRTKDILGICHKGKGPFYSGIFGQFVPNKGMSATDVSCPSLACPQMAKKQIAERHSLVKLLRDYRAFNQTNLDLVRVILACGDYPSFVEDEHVPDEEPETPTEKRKPDQGYITEVKETVEQSTQVGLRAVLEAQQLLTREFRASGSGHAEQGFAEERRNLENKLQGCSPLAAILVLSLTPQRRRSLAELPIFAVASAYLAIEAGKSLVFKRVAKGFSQISRFPHLQARAVIQSMLSYHTEYNGEMRLQIRHAIIGSRRHGDFGRVFVPYNMPIASRGLRDWLEVLLGAAKKRKSISHLAELDGHLAEIYNNWRQELLKTLQATFQAAAKLDGQKLESGRALQNGVVFKSVVLISLPQLLEIALRGIKRETEERVLKLIELTREERSSLKITARLPGYKRQTGDQEKVEMEVLLHSGKKGENARESDQRKKWVIMRRILMHYNWLSTRVGDDSVPVSGMVQAIITLRSDNVLRGDNMLRSEPKHPEVIGFDSLVPLRQQRFRELLGADWERRYFPDLPHPDDIELFVDDQEFNKTLKTELQAVSDLAKQGPAPLGNTGSRM